ncbi:MAG: AI-2E family transporter [Muribaculaceae bacterium]|nr:AI-2E family transporter [Muribaculaceae bacterium]
MSNQLPTPSSANERRPYTFDRVVRMLITLVCFLAVIWLIDVLRDVLLPFCVAWLLAYLLEPFVLYNQKLLRVKRRWLPVFMTLFECVLLMAAMGVFVIPSLVEEMHQLAQFVSRYAETPSHIPFLPDSFHSFIKENIDFRDISRRMTSQDLRSLFNTAGTFLSGGLNIVLSIFNWFVAILYLVFIMLDYYKISKGVKRLVPPKYREITGSIAHDIKDSMNHYFRGQALVAFCVGVLFSIGFCIIKLPLAIVLGMFIGLLNMVPYLQLISIVPTTLLCLVYSVDSSIDFWTIWWECIAVYAVVQVIQDLILTPKIMGSAMGLNPALILLSLSVWGTLLGFIGLIIALPLTTLLLAYYDRYLSTREDGETPDERRVDRKTFKDIISGE